MNAVGIDVSKGKSTVSVLHPLDVVVAKPFEVHHTASELKELADYLKSLDGETRIVLEHTGWYYEPVAQMLHDAGLFVSAVNPKLIKDYRNNSLRKVKTDKTDSRKIALYGLDNWAELLRTEMNRLTEQLPEYPMVMAMGGVGKSLHPQLIDEIGDVTHFAHKGSLSAYAGVDPGTNRLAHMMASHTMST